MAEHEPCIGATSDWYTPPEYFEALGLVFDLDRGPSFCSSRMARPSSFVRMDLSANNPVTA